MSTKSPITAKQLREMAETIRNYAVRYEDFATEMDEVSISQLMVTGITSFESHVISGLGRHTRRIRALLSAEIDAKGKQLVAETSDEYIPNEKKTPKKVIRQAKKPNGKRSDDNQK